MVLEFNGQQLARKVLEGFLEGDEEYKVEKQHTSIVYFKTFSVFKRNAFYCMELGKHRGATEEKIKFTYKFYR